ncbi:MAG: amidohydrolase [Crocinitomicaceae bacterium]|nr:amidohydrolase [Crocinitomicaceae bacterium]
MFTSKLFFFTSVMVILSSCMKRVDCDLVIHNAKIYSMNNSHELFEAMAIKDGKILELGPERQILNKYSYSSAYDAQLMTIYPGFIDAHCHFLGYGLSLQQINLKACRSFDEVLLALSQFQINDTLGWIEGRGWDQTTWKNTSYPNKQRLDSLFSNQPVIIRRIDGHAALVNSKALEIAGITSATIIEGGHIEIINNELTGILIDNAVDSVLRLIPAPTISQKKRALLKAQANCFEVGLTTVDDAGLKKTEIEAIQALHKSGSLKMRIYAMLTDNEENFAHYLKNGPIKTNKLNVRSFKFYGDGALGSRGACLLRPYKDDTNNYGMLLSDEDYFKTKAQALYKAGFQMNTHCIGDSAARLIMKIYGEVLQKNNDKRWRIEHAQLVHHADVNLFKQFNIIPSVQPTHATSDMRWAVLRVGVQRLKYGYAYEKLRSQNGMIALGTDFPIENISPIETFYAAVARKDVNGTPKNGFQIEDALSRLNAMKGMTIWAATANFEEKEKGSLEIGKLADFVILNRDIMSCEEDDILQTQVIRTYIDGNTVFKN